MIALSLAQLAEVLGIDPIAADGEFVGVTIDSRQSCDGKLFVAISGENFDGHDYVDATQGAVAALVERPVDSAIPQLVVDDCVAALGRLARFWRHQCNPRVVALTGSNGKTTVKEMVYRILSSVAPTLATKGNFNNEIGLPLTLFELDAAERYAVIEMGANHRGEIARLTRIAEPDIVYVNNAASAHLEGFGGLQGVVEAKGEIYAYCQPEHSALFNLDEPASAYWQDICAATTRLGCALDHAADVSLDWRAVDGGIELDVDYDGARESCRARRRRSPPAVTSTTTSACR